MHILFFSFRDMLMFLIRIKFSLTYTSVSRVWYLASAEQIFKENEYWTIEIIYVKRFIISFESVICFFILIYRGDEYVFLYT